jgi:hypothetical protein
MGAGREASGPIVTWRGGRHGGDRPELVWTANWSWGPLLRAWRRSLRGRGIGAPGTGRIQERRSNNHGTMAGAARAAVSRYLGDTQDLARTAQVLKGWMGDRSSYTFPLSNYAQGAATYMSDAFQPRPVNPVGAVVLGRNVGGWQPHEQPRCGTFQWLPCYTVYPWGGLAGAVVTAEILYRAGYRDVYGWESPGAAARLHRPTPAVRCQQDLVAEAVAGDDSWQPWLANFTYGTNVPTISPTRPGRNIGWTDWTHTGRRSGSPPPPPPPQPKPPPARPLPPPLALSALEGPESSPGLLPTWPSSG